MSAELKEEFAKKYRSVLRLRRIMTDGAPSAGIAFSSKRPAFSASAFYSHRAHAFATAFSRPTRQATEKRTTINPETVEKAETELKELLIKVYGSLENYIKEKYQPLIDEASEYNIDLKERLSDGIKMHTDQTPLSNTIRNINLWLDGERAVLSDWISMKSVSKTFNYSALSEASAETKAKLTKSGINISGLRVTEGKVVEIGKISLRGDWPHRDITIEDNNGNKGTVIWAHVDAADRECPVDGLKEGQPCIAVISDNGYATYLAPEA